jgi:hypothetical protein
MGKNKYVRFQVLMAATMMMTAFWSTVPCSLVEVDRRFRGAYGLHHRSDDGGMDDDLQISMVSQHYSMSERLLISFFGLRLHMFCEVSGKRQN